MLLRGTIVNCITPMNSVNKVDRSKIRLQRLKFVNQVDVKKIIVDEENGYMDIDFVLEETQSGEFKLGAGYSDSSGAIFNVKVQQDNFLGKGISINTQLKLSEEDIKGNFTISNPNFQNSDKSVYFNLQALETDRMKTSGYKTNKTGFTFGTDFEYYDDLFFGIGNSNYYEKISTDATASARQQAQKGNYWDSFINLNFTQDKRNQKFKTTRG